MATDPAVIVTIRTIETGDAERLSELEIVGRDYLLRGGPVRSDDYVSPDGQRAAIANLLRGREEGRTAPFVIEAGGIVVGRITIADIVRGPFHSGNLGYGVAEEAAGRGVATAAVTLVVDRAFGELNLHRLQAGTRPENAASLRVLEKAGFERIGFAAAYLRTGGAWQDHVLVQRVNPDWTDPEAG